MKTYTTKEIADAVGIHVNTVRFYEKIGFITPPMRRENGYRSYTELQLEQCCLVRRAMRAEVLQNGLRAQAVEIVRLCAARDFDMAIRSAAKYLSMIQGEIIAAETAAASVENALCDRAPSGASPLRRIEAARALNVTPETLRTWERSGLLTVGRRENGYRVYTSADMERLNIIRTLRCANYSLSAILRLMNGLDGGSALPVGEILNTLQANEDIVSTCDRLVVSLKNTEADAEIIKNILEKMKEKFLSLH